MLNAKQDYAFKKMITGTNIFITGPGGTGKSYLINHFIEYLKKIRIDPRSYAITSTTGLSGMLINGQTLHSMAGIGIGQGSFEELLEKVNNNYFSKKRWKEIKILLIDEISMLSPRLFEKLDAIARRIRKRYSVPFGGIQIIIFGDFFQLPCIGSDKFCFEAVNWNETIKETCILDEIVRQKDTILQSILNRIRYGIVDKEVEEVLTSRKIESFHKEFPDFDQILPTILYARKMAVNKYNEKKLKECIDNSFENNTYKCRYEYIKSNSKELSDGSKKFMRVMIDKNTNIANKLMLSVNTQVMITVNNKDLKVANGTRGIIVEFTKNKEPIIELLDKRRMIIEYHPFEFEDSNKHKIRKHQLPLKLAWALTIHKSQGLSLDYVCTDIGETIFEYGQVYVVLSRVKSIKGLFIKNIDLSKIRAHPTVIDYYSNLTFQSLNNMSLGQNN